jgi:hypothetical protein
MQYSSETTPYFNSIPVSFTAERRSLLPAHNFTSPVSLDAEYETAFDLAVLKSSPDTSYPFQMKSSFYPFFLYFQYFRMQQLTDR